MLLKPHIMNRVVHRIYYYTECCLFLIPTQTYTFMLLTENFFVFKIESGVGVRIYEVVKRN